MASRAGSSGRFPSRRRASSRRTLASPWRQSPRWRGTAAGGRLESMQLAGATVASHRRHRRPRAGDRRGAGRARRDPDPQRPQRRGAGAAGRRAARRGHITRSRRPLPGRARRRSWSPTPATSTSSSPTPACAAPGRSTDYSDEEIERAIRVNLEAPVRWPASVMERMVERGSGHMVFIASLAGKAASPRSSLYNATKFGLRGFALGLRADLRPGRGRRLARLARVRARGGDVRRLRRQAAAGPRHDDPRAGRRRGRARRSSATRWRSRWRRSSSALGAHLALATPGARRCASQSGGFARRAAEEATVGDDDKQ